MSKKLRYSEYKKLFQKGERRKTPLYSIFFIKYKEQINKASVKKQAGNAVHRNYEKRIIRHILRDITFKDSFLILVVCRYNNNLPFIEKKQSIEKALSDII